MPNMTRSDFGDRTPRNAAEILQFINNLIVYHEECVFWSDDPDGTEAWEQDLIDRYLAGDRSGNLAGAPDPIY